MLQHGGPLPTLSSSRGNPPASLTTTSRVNAVSEALPPPTIPIVDSSLVIPSSPPPTTCPPPSPPSPPPSIPPSTPPTLPSSATPSISILPVPPAPPSGNILTLPASIPSPRGRNSPQANPIVSPHYRKLGPSVFCSPSVASLRSIPVLPNPIASSLINPLPRSPQTTSGPSVRLPFHSTTNSTIYPNTQTTTNPNIYPMMTTNPTIYPNTVIRSEVKHISAVGTQETAYRRIIPQLGSYTVQPLIAQRYAPVAYPAGPRSSFQVLSPSSGRVVSPNLPLNSDTLRLHTPQNMTLLSPPGPYSPASSSNSQFASSPLFGSLSPVHTASVRHTSNGVFSALGVSPLPPTFRSPASPSAVTTHRLHGAPVLGSRQVTSNVIWGKGNAGRLPFGTPSVRSPVAVPALPIQMKIGPTYTALSGVSSQKLPSAAGLSPYSPYSPVDTASTQDSSALDAQKAKEGTATALYDERMQRFLVDSHHALADGTAAVQTTQGGEKKSDSDVRVGKGDESVEKHGVKGADTGEGDQAGSEEGSYQLTSSDACGSLSRLSRISEVVSEIPSEDGEPSKEDGKKNDDQEKGTGVIAEAAQNVLERREDDSETTTCKTGAAVDGDAHNAAVAVGELVAGNTNNGTEENAPEASENETTRAVRGAVDDELSDHTSRYSSSEDLLAHTAMGTVATADDTAPQCVTGSATELSSSQPAAKAKKGKEERSGEANDTLLKNSAKGAAEVSKSFLADEGKTGRVRVAARWASPLPPNDTSAGFPQVGLCRFVVLRLPTKDTLSNHTSSERKPHAPCNGKSDVVELRADSGDKDSGCTAEGRHAKRTVPPSTDMHSSTVWRSFEFEGENLLRFEVLKFPLEASGRQDGTYLLSGEASLRDIVKQNQKSPYRGEIELFDSHGELSSVRLAIAVDVSPKAKRSLLKNSDADRNAEASDNVPNNTRIGNGEALRHDPSFSSSLSTVVTSVTDSGAVVHKSIEVAVRGAVLSPVATNKKDQNSLSACCKVTLGKSTALKTEVSQLLRGSSPSWSSVMNFPFNGEQTLKLLVRSGTCDDGKRNSEFGECKLDLQALLATDQESFSGTLAISSSKRRRQGAASVNTGTVDVLVRFRPDKVHRPYLTHSFPRDALTESVSTSQ